MGQEQSKKFPHLSRVLEKTSVEDLDNSFEKAFQELKQLPPTEQTQRIMHLQLELTSGMSYLLLLQSTLQSEDAKLRKQLQQAKGQVLQQLHQAADQAHSQDDQQLQQIRQLQLRQLKMHKSITKGIVRKPKQPTQPPATTEDDKQVETITPTEPPTATEQQPVETKTAVSAPLSQPEKKAITRWVENWPKGTD